MLNDNSEKIESSTVKKNGNSMADRTENSIAGITGNSVNARDVKRMGKVWLVGAGPGDAGLVTVKAKRLIESADVIVLDRLVGPAVAAMIPESARVIYVGKNAGRHTICQADINEIIASEAEKGLRVVRLKGGDPFVFGRGGEELEELNSRGVPYEVVPGVTSPVAAAAYAGIPVTHRDIASSLHIITAHHRKENQAGIDFAAYAKLKGTLIFLMGVSALHGICAGLTENGMAPDTPVSIVERGTTALQRRIDGTLGTIVEEARKKGVAPPSIIIVGGVSAFGKAFDWTKSLPLFGKCVIVTRPRSQQSRLSTPLRDLGAEVLEAPAIKIIPRSPGGSGAAAVMDALNAAASAKFIIFTSANGVECFINAVRENKMDIRRFANAKIAVIGAGTEKMLNSFALSAEYMPEVYDARHLAEGVAGLCNPGDKVVSFRAAEGSSAINEVLEKKGIELLDIPVYDTVPHEGCHLLIKPYAGYCLDAGRELIVALTSASTARSSAAALCEYTENPLVQAVCIGEMTALAAREMGFKNIHVARKATIESMIEIITSLAAAKGETADNGY